MPFKINHIHIKSPDPRTTAEWYEKAFGFKIVSDETRVFGDRFIRCSSGRRHAAFASPTRAPARRWRRPTPTRAGAWSTSPSSATTSRPTSPASTSSAPSCRRARSRRPTARCSPSSPRRTTCASSCSSCRRSRPARPAGAGCTIPLHRANEGLDLVRALALASGTAWRSPAPGRCGRCPPARARAPARPHSAAPRRGCACWRP